LLILQHFAEKEKGKFHPWLKVYRKFKNATEKDTAVNKTPEPPTMQAHAG
jgi:hypothetical protein